MLTILLILIPIATALLVLSLGGRSVKQLALIGALAELATAVVVWTQFDPAAGAQFGFKYAWIASAGISFAASIDGISMLLVLLTTFLTPLIILSAFGHNYKNPSAFFSLILFMEAALVGVFTATDAFLFYLFFEAALIPIYFLAAIWGGENRLKVTFKFFVYTIFGSLFMLVALVYLYFQTPGTHTSEIAALYNLQLTATAQGWVFWAFFIAFAVKMPLFPFHTWQPDTYTESPTPATMLLAGIMLKMGIYGLIRLLLPITPLALNQWGSVAIVLSVIGIVYGLFFIIDIIFSRTNTRYLDHLGGLTQKSPRLSVYFMILLLGSVALPLTSGFVGEFLLLAGVFEYSPWLGAISGLTIILAAVYLLRMFQKAMFGQPTSPTEHFKELTISERAVLIPLTIMVFWIGIYP